MEQLWQRVTMGAFGWREREREIEIEVCFVARRKSKRREFFS
jgi:hypothetical protein